MINDKERTKLILRTIFTGLIGGILFFIGFVLSYYFNFVDQNITKLIPMQKLTKLIPVTFLRILFQLSLTSIFSIIISLIYYTLLKRFTNIWFSVLFGLILFIMFFSLAILINKEIEITSFSIATYITIGSLFTLYGTFIGYSISFDYLETKRNTVTSS